MIKSFASSKENGVNGILLQLNIAVLPALLRSILSNTCNNVCDTIFSLQQKRQVINTPLTQHG